MQLPTDSIHRVVPSFAAHCSDFIFGLLLVTFVFLADDEAPPKTAKVEIPPTQIGGVVQAPLGMGFPPRSTIGVMPPVYVSVKVYSLEYVACSFRVSSKSLIIML